MALAEAISKLDTAESLEKQEHYLCVSKLLLETTDSACSGIDDSHIKSLCSNLLNDLKKEDELPQLVKTLQSLFLNKHLQKHFPEKDRIQIFKDVVNTIDCCQHESLLVNYFSILIHIPSVNVDNSLLNDLLQKIDDVISKKNEPASTYSACNYFQKFLKDYEERLSNFIPVLTKLVFLPLCHPSNKVREVAEKTLDLFPKILLYSADEQAVSLVMKLLKENYCRDMLQLFREKQEFYILKVWTHLVKTLGNQLSGNLTAVASFFQSIEKGFKSSNDEVCIASFIAWKTLIDNFSCNTGVLNDSKRLRFILKPFKNITRSSENVLSVVCDAWMHLVWHLAGNLSTRFSEVCIPLLELTVGRISNGLPDKISPKAPLVLVKKACYILLRLLELPPTDAFSKLASPKKLPYIPYATLQAPLDIKIITHHFKEILYVFKAIIDVCGTKEDMKMHIDCLMKSILFVISTVIEDTNKESVEAVNLFLNFLSEIIETKIYSSLACLKCLESLSKLPRKVLVSHCFNCGSRKPQDILCTSLLKLLLSPHLFPSEAPKRFFATYARLIQSGIHESFHPLSNTYKFMHVIRSAVGINSFDVEVFIELWCGIANPLLELIEKTQEVNQGDKQEHDFSCMYDVLLFPFEFIFSEYILQFRTRPVVKLWTSLYQAFIRSASLVATTSANEACENFCFKLKSHLKEDVLKKPHFIESFCVFLQSIMESIDFGLGGSTSGAQGTVDIASLLKRKKPLGNLTSFVDLVAILVKAYQAYYLEEDEDSVQSTAPAIQRKVHIVKNAAPIDIIKTYFGNLKSGSTISLSLEQLVVPISKLFMKSSQKQNLVHHNDAKLEAMWSVICSAIERYYLGPYDSEFLSLMSPILEATFSHPKRNIKEKSRRFWFATFAPNASTLKFPDSLKNLLKKMKLPLLPDDISPVEFSGSPMVDSLPEDSIGVDVSSSSAQPSVISQIFKSPLTVNGEVSKVKQSKELQPKGIKPSSKISIDDLPSEEFVKIDSPVINTHNRRNARKRKSFVPSLYNDLSQDTASLMDSSESQDTTNSASLDPIDLKDIEVEIKASANEETVIPPTSHKDVLNASTSIIKSPLVSKFEEKLGSLKNQRNVEEIVLLESFDDDEAKTNAQKDVPQPFNMSPRFINKRDLLHDKMSVFCKPGEKKLPSRGSSRGSKKYPKLSQSFSVLSTNKDSEKMESQKLNKTCIEVISLIDDEDVIPSSQSSAETESSVKLSVNNGHQVKQSNDNSNFNEIKPDVCLSPKQCNMQIDCKDFLIEKPTHKIVTSTPLKRQCLSQESDEECNIMTDICKDGLHNVADSADVLAINMDKTNKIPVALDKDEQNFASNNLSCIELEIQRSSDETIKDVNIVIDAVDNIVNVVPEIEHVVETVDKNVNLLLEVGADNLSNSQVKMDAPDEKIPSPYEPVAKRSRLSRRLLDCSSSQNENISQTLEKKNIDTTKKSQSNQVIGSELLPESNTAVIKKAKGRPAKKRKTKKDKICAKNANDELIEIDDVPTQTVITEDKDASLVCSTTEIEVKKEQNVSPGQESHKDQNSLNAESIKLKNGRSDIPGEKVQNTEKFCDTVEINSGADSQNFETSESCEIFDNFSNTCGDTEDVDVEMASSDSDNSENASQAEDKISNPDSQEKDLLSQSSIISGEASQDSISNKENSGVVEELVRQSAIVSGKACQDSISGKENADVVEITMIPCSIENDGSLPSNPESVEVKYVDEGANVHPIEMQTDVEKKIYDLKNDVPPSSVEFSIIEDDVSFEINDVVESIIGGDSEINVNDDLPINSEESKVPNLQFPVIACISGSTVCDNMYLSDSPAVISEATSNDCVQENSSSITYDSCDIIMASNTEENLNFPFPALEKSALGIQVTECNENPSTEEQNLNEIKLCSDRADKKYSEYITSSCDSSYSGSDPNHNNLHICHTSETEPENENDETEPPVLEQIIFESDTVSKRDISKSSNCPYSVFNSDSHEMEVGHIVKDLVVEVEKLIFNYFDAESNFPVNENESVVKADVENIPSDSNEIANKENKIAPSKGSKKRKNKAPIRSPFNFRKRTKKLPAKNLKSLNDKDVVDKDMIKKTLFTKTEIKDEVTTDSMSKIISSIVESIGVEDDNSELSDAPSSSLVSRGRRISNDELTDINTRLNAQIVHQTRRIRMVADSQTSFDENDSEPLDVTNVCTEDGSNNLSSILKKRKAAGPESPKKVRKVTFASPLIHELVFESSSETRSIEPLVANRIQNMNKKRKKILQIKNKKGLSSDINSLPATQPAPNESEDIQSSSECQDSAVLDFSDLPVSPALINCPDDISKILRDLTSPSWICGLESLLSSKNIKTIGDVCKLNIHQVKALPFKSPKVVTLHKALMSYITSTQDSTLEKIRTIDDGSLGEMDDTAVSTQSAENSKTDEKMESSNEDSNSVLLEETIRHIINKDILKELPLNLLAQLNEVCARALVEKIQQS